MPIPAHRLGYFVSALPTLPDMDDFEIWSDQNPATNIPTHWEHHIPELPIQQYISRVLACLSFLLDKLLLRVPDILLQDHEQYATAIRDLAQADPPLFVALFAKLSADAELLDACRPLFVPHTGWHLDTASSIQDLFLFFDYDIGPAAHSCQLY
jgi:hypothetical protein